jgi:cytoplasmic iron level regulating protein YaaA (DUF328/UPF0246 family)
MKLMKIKKPLADLNVRRFKEFRMPFSEANAKAAIFAFRGDTYIGFDVDTLDAKALKFAQEHLRILSGLYGLLRPLDLMQAYRLEMGTKLRTERGKDLYAFWGDRINQAINAELEPKRSGIIVNLASNEYIKAVVPERLNGTFVDCVFKEKRGNTALVIGFSAKRARGMMARFICQQGATSVDQLKDFSMAGYKFQPKLSSGTHLEFHRAS